MSVWILLTLWLPKLYKRFVTHVIRSLKATLQACKGLSFTFSNNFPSASAWRQLLTNSSAILQLVWCFLFYQKMCLLFNKNSILCLFLKNVSPPKRAVCFILNNLHFPMVEGIAFYALYKSGVLIIPYKPDDFCLFIQLPDEI